MAGETSGMDLAACAAWKGRAVRRTGVMALGLSCLMGASWAQSSFADSEAGQQAAADDGPHIGWLESTREYTYRGTHWLARSIDGWFGDEPFENRGEVSGYIRINTLWDQHDGTNANIRFRLRAELPNLESRAYAFVGQDNEREVVTDQPDNFSREQLLLRENRRNDQSFFAGLGYDFMDNVDFRVGFRGGLNFYAQARYRNEWVLSPRDVIYFRESVFWSSKDSFGSTTVVDYEHALTNTLAARWSTSGTITRRSDGFEWHSGVGLFKEFTGVRTAAVEGVVQGRIGSVDISNYGLRTSWRQPIYKDWLFGKVTLGHFWPKEREMVSREKAWALGLTFDMYF